MNKKRSWTDWKSCWASRTFRSKITVDSLSNVSKTHQVNRLIRCPMKILEAVINSALACQYILYLNAILSSFTKRSLRSSFSLVCENIFFFKGSLPQINPKSNTVFGHLDLSECISFQANYTWMSSPHPTPPFNCTGIPGSPLFPKSPGAPSKPWVVSKRNTCHIQGHCNTINILVYLS